MFDASDRVLIYPIDKENLTVVKSTKNYPNIQICHLVTPESWGHSGEYYDCAKGMVEVSHDYESALNDSSVIWIVDSWNDLDFKMFIEPAIRLASEKGKRIVCSRSLSEREKELIRDIEVVYIEYSSGESIIERTDRVQEIKTPIIFVASITEFCNQFYIETALCAELRNRDYETLLISSRKESIAFGGHSIPDFMFHGEYNENKKVLSLNHYIRHLEIEHRPEIIVVGIPGVAMPYDYQYSSDFGIIAYEISEAAKPDFVVLASPCMPYDMNFFKGVEESLHGRLGVFIDIHSLAPYALDLSESSVNKRLSYLSVDDYYVQKIIEQISYVNLLNLNHMQGISSAADKFVDKLSGGLGALVT